MSLQKTGMDNLNKETVDWREGKTLPNCMLYMLENEIMCDVTFRVGESCRIIKAHKIILASRSLVFHTMFEGSLPEKGEINIPDIDEDIFNNLLRYAYSDEIQISTENVNNMLYAADKYMLSTITTKCCELLKSTAQSSDAVVTLSTANRFHLEVLQKESLHYIEENTEECLLSSHAVQMNSECVQIIITSEYLSCSETEVCKFFLKWVDAQCKLQGKEVNADNLKAIAGGLMAFIKFPLVEKTYFSSEVSHSLLLTKEEVISVFRSHHGDKCLLFSDKPRYSSSDLKTVCLYRSTNVRKPWTSTAVNALKFCSSKSIWIKGCIIFGPVFNTVTDDLTFRFELIDNSENVICDEVLDMRTNTSVNNTIAIKLMKQTRLKANEKYTIMVRNIKPSTYYGIDCKSICNQEGISVIFENSPKSRTNTDVNHGQIAGIIFSI